MKNVKAEALAAMAKGESPEPDTHMAKCPKCGYEWEMSDEDYVQKD